MLDVLKFPEEGSHEYEENLKVKMMLPINENVRCNICMPWKVKTVFLFNGQNNSSENFNYHLNPELS